MKKLVFSIILLTFLMNGYATHIKGGFLTYRYLGPGSAANTLSYDVTLTVYMNKNPTPGQLTDPIDITFFNGDGPVIFNNVSVNITKKFDLSKNTNNPCISGDQTGIYYTVVIYEISKIDLPISANGYTVSYQRCCRIANMDNVIQSDQVGNTYSIKIPGTSSPVPDANKNSSPVFLINDTAVICGGSYFALNLGATDIDGDSLSYSLCNAFIGGSTDNPAPDPAAAPSYISVIYQSPFNGSQPMGPQVNLNPTTGLLSGIAPLIGATGEYVVTVCVAEYRNGVHFADSRKELHVRVRDCVPLQAILNPVILTCDGFNLNFSNEVANPSGTVYQWDFGDLASGLANTSNLAAPSHTYTDTGTYKVRLIVSIAGLCADTTTCLAKVYPGFFPAFSSFAPYCKKTLVSFADQSVSKYGSITGWQWNFGDTAVNVADSVKNVSSTKYAYPGAGTYTVTMVVANTYGCVDTVKHQVTIEDLPTLGLSPTDTLICSIDTLQIKTSTSGSYQWSPNYNISSLTDPNPFVSPDIPTTYYARLTDLSGCSNIDSVFVNVKQFVTIHAGNDTTICRTDAMIINTVSDAVSYQWSPPDFLDNPTAKNPVATPTVPSITYTVIGNIGKCQSSDKVTIKTVPYPAANAGEDKRVCYNQSTQIDASGGTTYSWSPASFLSNPNIKNPLVINPTQTTTYIVSVTDGQGCPKPSFDTVVVYVRTPIQPSTGVNDTSLVIGETIQLNGSGGEGYSWTPTTWLSNPNIANPVASPEDDITYRVQVTQLPEGCTGFDTVKIKVYLLPPSFYVPTAFSPNGDGRNEILRPVALGIKSIKYFRIFNRAGQLIFSTTQLNAGWDGTYKGSPQDPGTYVWMAEGVTYKGEPIIRKGSAILIR